ncbi:MAG: glycosyltransferase family 2 protein [Cytophagales bacterium]
MKISLITVCFNAGNTLENCILSVINQNYEQLEYIIIDGGSTDHTPQIISKYQSFISHSISEPDGGLYHAMNKGIALATGKIVGMLNADDYFAHNLVLSNISKAFAYHNSDALYADLQYVKGDKIIRHWKSGNYDIKKWYFGWMPPHPTFYVKRDLYQKYGNFNLDFRLAADYELMLRFLLKNRVSVCYLPEVTIKMAVGGESNKSLSNRVNANLEDKKAWITNNLSMPFYLSLLKPLRKIGQFIFK